MPSTGTGDETGDVIRSKKGDYLLTIDPALTRGADLRVVIECKDRSISGKQMRDELAEAKRNRAAQVGLVIFTPSHAPAGIAPFDVRLGDVYCVIDPEAPDPAVLDAAIRLARLHGIATLAERELEVDTAAIGAAIIAVRGQMDAIRALKMQLTSIGTTTRDVHAGLDKPPGRGPRRRRGRGTGVETGQRPRSCGSGGRLSSPPGHEWQPPRR